MDDDRQEQMLDRLSLTRMIEVAVAGGVIDAVEGRVLGQLMNGVGLEHIAQSSEVMAALADSKLKIGPYVNDIVARIRRHATQKKSAAPAATQKRSAPSTVA